MRKFQLQMKHFTALNLDSPKTGWAMPTQPGAPLGFSQDGCKTAGKTSKCPLKKEQSCAVSDQNYLFNVFSRFSPQNTTKRLSFFIFSTSKEHSMVLRTGAAHPLPNFSGCGCTRRTRSNCGPATQPLNTALLWVNYLKCPWHLSSSTFLEKTKKMIMRVG